MPGTAYLGKTMLARLLACLALVTGLAAVGAPVNAGVLASASQQIESDGSSSSPTRNSACTCTHQRSLEKAIDQALNRCRTRKPAVIYMPTVQFGADRAYE